MIEKPFSPKIYKPQDGSCVLDLDCRDIRGSKIYDRSGKGNHGAITGAVIKPMNYGLPVLDLDGVDDYINCGNDDSLDIGTGSFTFEMIVKNALTGGNYGGIFYGNGNTSTQAGWIFRIWNVSGDIIFSGGDDSNNVFKIEMYSVIGKGERAHFSGVLDRENGVAILYKNGIEIGRDTSITAGSINYNYRLFIGKDWSADYCFKGQIASVQILKRARKSSEISQRFQNKRHIIGI